MTAATVTALDWYRHHNDNWTWSAGQTLTGKPPVGPDLAVGLPPTSFFDEAFDDVLQSDGLMVAMMLDDPERHPSLPARAVVELEAENAVRADLAAWPNYTDGLE